MKAVGSSLARVLGAWLMALCLGACSSCGPSDGGPAPPPTVREFAYFPDPIAHAVVAFRVDPEYGSLTPAPGTALPPYSYPHTIAITPSGKFAFVTGSYQDLVLGYSINPETGAWGRVSGSPFEAGLAPSHITVEPKGRFAYATNNAHTAIIAFAIGGTGMLAPVAGSPFAAPYGPVMVAVEAQGRFAYVLNTDLECVSAYSVDQQTGALAALPGPPLAVGSNPQQLTLDPLGRFVYVANIFSRDISAFAIDRATGTLTPVAGSPFAASTWVEASPASIAVTPSGKFAYAACHGFRSISSFTIDAATGALIYTATYPVTLLSGADYVAIEPSGRFLYVVYSDNPSPIGIFAINPDTGLLSPKMAPDLTLYPGEFVFVRTVD